MLASNDIFVVICYFRLPKTILKLDRRESFLKIESENIKNNKICKYNAMLSTLTEQIIGIHGVKVPVYQEWILFDAD